MTEYPVDNYRFYSQVMFRPGFGLQARELNEIQNIGQRQLAALGSHFFKSGDRVSGGAYKIRKAYTVKVSELYSGVEVDLDAFIGQEIFEIRANGNKTGASGIVFAVSKKTDTEAAALHFRYTSTTQFGEGVEIQTEENDSVASILTADSPIQVCQYVQLNEGWYYFNRRFVHVEPQLAMMSKFSTDFDGEIGIVYSNSIVTEFDDEDLFDNAEGFPNENAPGAHRLRFDGVLTVVPKGQEAPENFISIIVTTEEGEPAVEEKDDYSDIMKILARRTYDESGDYVSQMFNATLLEEINRKIKSIEPSSLPQQARIETVKPHTYKVGERVQLEDAGTYTGTYVIQKIDSENEFSILMETSPTVTLNSTGTCSRPDYFGVQLSRGKAYVRGWEVENSSPVRLEVPRARSTKVEENAQLSVIYGRFFKVHNVSGLPNINGSASNVFEFLNATSDVIGTAKIRAFENTSTGVYNVYFYESIFTTGKRNQVRSIRMSNSLGGLTFTADILNPPIRVLSMKDDLILPIGKFEVATTSPNGDEPISYQHQYGQYGPTTSGEARFSVSGQLEYAGPRGVDFAGTTSASQFFQFTDLANGNILIPTSLTISTDGLSVEAGFVTSPDEVAMNAMVYRQAQPRKKTIATKTVTIPEDTINSANPEFDLETREVLSFKVTDVATGNDVTSGYTVVKNDTDIGCNRDELRLVNGLGNQELSVELTYFTYSSGQGPFTADSYPDDAPDWYHVKASNAQKVNMRNAIDFRRYGGNEFFPWPGSAISFDYSYYLPRRDLIVATTNGEIQHIPGKPSLHPKYPEVKPNQMVLFKMEVGARTTTAKQYVTLTREQVERLTMDDLNEMKSRIERLEYEVALSALENRAKNSQIVDENGLSRFKTGFLVDSFTKHGLGFVNHGDYQIAMDKAKGELRPLTKVRSVGLEAFGARGTCQIFGDEDTNGRFAMLKSTRVTLLNNNIASKGVSVTHFLNTKREGRLVLRPSSDFWRDDTRLPVRNIDLSPELQGVEPGTETIFGEWETDWVQRENGGNFWSQTISTTEHEIRQGTETTTSVEEERDSLGTRIRSINVSHWMRQVDVRFRLAGMRPDTNLYLFIDDTRASGFLTSRSTQPTTGGAAVRTDSKGRANGVIRVPAGRFRTGDRKFRFTDEPNNVDENETTSAEFTFTANGIVTRSQEIVATTRTVETTTREVSETRVGETSIVTIDRERGNNSDDNDSDPIAQSFTISKAAYRQGVFLYDVDIFFKRKPTGSRAAPVRLQIRPMVNGYPSSNEVIPMSTIVMDAEDVKIPRNTNSLQVVRNTPTNFKFDAPIYLEAGKEYCVVLLSASREYEVFVSEMGQRILGSNQIIRNQPMLGSSFRSQNSRTWTAYQEEDLMLRIGIHRFDISTNGQFSLRAKPEDRLYYSDVSFEAETIEFTSTTKDIKLISRDAGSLITSTVDIDSKKRVSLPTRRVIRANNRNDLRFDITFGSKNKWISPIYDLDRQFVILSDNVINNLGLQQSDLIIERAGLGYENPTVEITGGGGSGATATLTVGPGGRVTAITLTNEGSNYTSEPTFTITDGAETHVAEIGYKRFETGPSGGNAVARYLSKVVKLENDFESDGADVYLDVCRPSGTRIQLYYRAKSAEDDQALDKKAWILATGPVPTTAANKFVENKWTLNLGYTRSGVEYDEVNEIQVKLVLLSGNKAVVPRCKNFRFITTI